MLHLNITKLAGISKEDILRLLEIEKTGHFAVSLPRIACKTKEELARSLREYICAVYFLQQLTIMAKHIKFFMPDIGDKGNFRFKFSKPLTKGLANLLEKASEFYNGTNAINIGNYRSEATAIWTSIRNQQITFECPSLIAFMKKLEEKARRALIETKTAPTSDITITGTVTS